MTSASDRIEEQAARWLIRLDSDSTPESSAQLDGWLAANPRHRAAFLRLSVAWKRLDRLKELREQRRRNLGFRVALACGLALMAAGIATHLALPRPDTSDYATGVGELERIALPDGSRIVLNTDSELHVRYTERRRTLRLLRGEAAFQVSHDAARPFDVHAGHSTVRALGTAFSVRIKDARNVLVSVTEGRVTINPPSPDILAAGDVVSVQGAAVLRTHVTPDLLLSRLSWTRGKLTFTGETLAEAVAEFNRYSARQFVIDDPRITQLRLSGVFVAGDVEAISVGLERTFGIRAVPADGGAIHLIGSGPG